jgi:hypothetical protein
VDSPLPRPEGTPETLAQEKLDRRDSAPDVRDLDLDALLLPAARTGRRDPHLSRCSKSSIEERGRDVIERSSGSLRKAGSNLRRVGVAVRALGRGLNLGNERLGRARLLSARMVATSDSFLTDLLHEARVVGAKRRAGDGRGAALGSAADERRALSERHEEMVTHARSAVHAH